MPRRLHSFEAEPDGPSGVSRAPLNERGDRTTRAISRWPTANDDNVNLNPARAVDTERTTAVRAATRSRNPTARAIGCQSYFRE